MRRQRLKPKISDEWNRNSGKPSPQTVIYPLVKNVGYGSIADIGLNDTRPK